MAAWQFAALAGLIIFGIWRVERTSSADVQRPWWWHIGDLVLGVALLGYASWTHPVWTWFQ